MLNQISVRRGGSSHGEDVARDPAIDTVIYLQYTTVLQYPQGTVTLIGRYCNYSTVYTVPP